MLVLLIGCESTPLILPAEDSGAPIDEADAGLAKDADPTASDSGTIDPIDASSSDVAPTDSGTVAADAGAEDGGALIGPTCFGDIYDPNVVGPDYDQFSPIVAQHCLGTNHQNIAGVERVVFLGDSVTVGTPPTPHDEYYRSVLADRLAAHFNLTPPEDLWKRSSILDGTALTMSSGDFASCSKWGARTDDLIEDNTQILDCFPEAERTKRTLVIMTMGGNDIAALTKAGTPSGGQTYAEVELMTMEFVQRLEEAVRWFREDPARFPNGVFIVFSNLFEFTDATGDVSSCPAAGAAGFDEAWANPADLEHLVIWANEQYLRIAVDTQTDMIFMLETFCGHGYHNDDPNGRCYRGPDTERWFDVSCIHPNPAGHSVIADMFMSEVLE